MNARAGAEQDQNQMQEMQEKQEQQQMQRGDLSRAAASRTATQARGPRRSCMKSLLASLYLHVVTIGLGSCTRGGSHVEPPWILAQQDEVARKMATVRAVKGVFNRSDSTCIFTRLEDSSLVTAGFLTPQFLHKT